MLRLNGLGWLAFILMVIGAINWGLVGFLEYDLVAALFGELTLLSKIIYSLVGLSGLYMIILASTAGEPRKTAI